MNGIKYFEKPPLQTWMNALTFNLRPGRMAGPFMDGLCGFSVSGWRLYRPVSIQPVGRHCMRPGAGIEPFWWASGQINSLDMSLSGMMTIVLASLLFAQRDGATASEQRNWMLVCWAGMALAVLAKADRHRAARRRAGAVHRVFARLAHLDPLHLI